MDIWTKIIKHFFYPLWQIYDGNKKSLKYLKYFNYIDKMDRMQLMESQQKKLHEILIHAYDNTNYYKKIFEQVGLDPHGKSYMDTFYKVPYLTKSIVKNNYDDLIGQNVPVSERTEASTGGSTGVPMYFLRDKASLYLRLGQEYYFDNWMGYEIGQKMGFFVAGSHFDGRIQHLKAKFRNATEYRMVSFDPHDITDEYMARFAEAYRKYKPKFIKSFPNALTPLAHYVKRNNLEMPKANSISCTGETLYSQQRKLFEEVFGGKVFEKVGTRESGVFACECREHDGMHIFTEGVVLEVLDQNGDPVKEGESGRIYITDLFNKAMPLIRYEIGDMAISGGDRVCTCGSQLPLIEKYLGRDRDIVFDSWGNPKPGYLFVEVIKHLNLDAQIQVLQKDKKTLLVKIVKDARAVFDISQLIKEYAKIVGPEIKILFEYPESIERDASGKFSYVKSEVKFGD
jgi:phenylacetate-CoA ligase